MITSLLMERSFENVISFSNFFVQLFDFAYDPNGDIPRELFYRGVVSLVLTILNIVCIVLMGVFMLFVKRVRGAVNIFL